MSDEVTVGTAAPDFSLPDQAENIVSLKSLKGQPVVLYFYPKDDTPGCTKESCDFRDTYTKIAKTGAVILGISLDSTESHRKFIKKYSLPFSLLSDEKAAVSKIYDVYKLKNMYGKTYWGIERSTFIIDQAGRIKSIFRKVKVDGHAEEILAVLKDRR
jgi:thioredoxin-dependent peroxiredoxin